MNTYKVSHIEEITYVTVVEAENEEGAHDTAMEQLDDKAKTKVTYGKYGETQVIKIPKGTALSKVEPEFR